MPFRNHAIKKILLQKRPGFEPISSGIRAVDTITSLPNVKLDDSFTNETALTLLTSVDLSNLSIYLHYKHILVYINSPSKSAQKLKNAGPYITYKFEFYHMNYNTNLSP